MKVLGFLLCAVALGHVCWYASVWALCKLENDEIRRHLRRSVAAVGQEAVEAALRRQQTLGPEQGLDPEWERLRRQIAIEMGGDDGT